MNTFYGHYYFEVTMLTPPIVSLAFQPQRLKKIMRLSSGSPVTRKNIKVRTAMITVLAMLMSISRVAR